MKTRFWFRKQQGTSTDVGILYATVTIHKKRSAPFSTGISINRANWDTKLQAITGKGTALLNDELLTFANSLLTIKQNLQSAGNEVTAEKVRSKFLNEQDGPISLFDLMLLHEIHQRAFGKGKKGKPLTKGTFDFYKTNRAYFSGYISVHKTVSTNPANINTNWLTRYDAYLANRPKKQLKPRSRNLAISYIQHVLRFGLADEKINKAPGIYYKPNPAPPTEPTPITSQECLLLERGTFCPAQERAVDCFLFLRYTGLHYVDGKNITEACLRTDENGTAYLLVTRQKTEEPAIIPYHEKAQRIAAKYGGLGNLPFTCWLNVRNQIRNAAKVVGIRDNITPGTARDTFADDCSNNMKMSDENIAAMLGHTTTSQVKKYRRISIDRITKEWKG